MKNEVVCFLEFRSFRSYRSYRRYLYMQVVVSNTIV